MLIGALLNGSGRPLFMTVIMLSISACTPMHERAANPDVRLTVSHYFQIGHAQLAQHQVQAAAATVDRMELIYPLHAETSQLQLELIEGRYDAGQMDQTIAAANRFITMFPGHKDVDYAYYLRGLADFARGVTSLSQMTDSPDPTYARHSLVNFMQLLERFPRSQYAANAQHYANYLQSQLDAYEYRLRGEMPLRVADADDATNGSVAIVETGSLAIAEPVLAQAEPKVIPAVVTASPATTEAVTVAAPAPQVDDRFYTIQVAAFDDLASLKKQVIKLGLSNEVGYYVREVKGRRVYAALYGDYPTVTAAKAVMVELRARTGVSDLWLRQHYSSELALEPGAAR